jgi:gamma-glutamyl-gamma-aminobutyrate hydrolase PuuD
VTIVAVSQRVDDIAGRGERRDSVDQRLIEWILAAGFQPVPVPNRLGEPTRLGEWLDQIRPTAMVLSGGNDVGAETDRDATEKCLLERARASGSPVLGICRGMQMMTVFAGGSLRRLEGHVRTRHRLRGEIDSDVNSYHDLALADCPKTYRVLALAEDGTIEAIAHEALPWQGWMWHPEREPTPSNADILRLKALFTTRVGRPT